MRSSFRTSNFQWAWDATSLIDLKLCPRRYQLSKVDGWEAKDRSIHLLYGHEVHASIEDYELYKAEGCTHDDAVKLVLKGLMGSTTDYPSDNDLAMMKGSAKNKTKENLIRTVIWYFDHYNPDPAQTLMLENGLPAVEVGFSFNIERNDILVCGRLDRIVRFNNATFVMDHKTSSYPLGNWYYDRFDLDTQMSLYTIAGQIIVHSPIRGVIIDAIHIDDSGYPEFGRGLTYRDPGRLEEWLFDLNYLIDQARRYADDQYWPMNETSCDKFGGCPFKSVCSKTPSVRQAYLEASFHQLPEDERWNPLQHESTSTTPSPKEQSMSSTQESYDVS